MSRIKLRKEDYALLERLNDKPLELGEIPPDTVDRLMTMGLVRKVLGCCEITHSGQLTLRRQHFLKASRRRVARVTRRNPMFLQEASLSVSAGRTRISEHFNMRRKIDAGMRQWAWLPKWLVKPVMQTADRFRSADKDSSGLDGMTRTDAKHKPR